MHIGKHTQRRFVASLSLGLLVYVGLAVFGDLRGVVDSLSHFKWWMLPLVFGLAFGNYVLRFVRWSYYLTILDISLPVRKSLTVFMSGLAMSVTPGKFGELIKSYFLKKMTGAPMRQTMPIVFAERFTDFLAIVTLAALGAASFNHGQRLIWVGAAGTVAALVVLMNHRLTVRIIGMLARISFLRKPADTLLGLYEHARPLLQIRPLLAAAALGLAAWFCECAAYYVTLDAIGFSMGLWPATFIYAFATFFGALTFLPGGLGATEGSMTGLAILQGMPKDAASAATIVIRLATLWFAVALGLLWLAPNRDALIPDEEELQTDGPVPERSPDQAL